MHWHCSFATFQYSCNLHNDANRLLLRLSCCAMNHRVNSHALQKVNEVVIYFATGRGPRILVRLVYVHKDALIIPCATSYLLRAPKSFHLHISGA